MQKLKLTPVANAKKLNRNELKSIFGGFGSGADFGSDGSCNKCKSHKDCASKGMLCGISMIRKKDGTIDSCLVCM